MKLDDLPEPTSAQAEQSLAAQEEVRDLVERMKAHGFDFPAILAGLGSGIYAAIVAHAVAQTSEKHGKHIGDYAGHLLARRWFNSMATMVAGHGAEPKTKH
jgi:hypothetical protein